MKSYLISMHRYIISEHFWLAMILLVAAVLRFWSLDSLARPELLFSATLGVLVVYGVFFVVRKLFADNTHLPIIAAFLASLNPWLISLSRKSPVSDIFLSLPVTLNELLSRWFGVFSGKVLFFEGVMGSPAPYQGMMLLSDILLLPLGFFVIFRNKLSRGILVLLSALIIAPVFLANHLIFVIALVVVSAFGLNFLLASTSEHKRKSFLLFIVFLSIIFSATYFLDAFFIHSPKI